MRLRPNAISLALLALAGGLAVGATRGPLSTKALREDARRVLAARAAPPDRPASGQASPGQVGPTLPDQPGCAVAAGPLSLGTNEAVFDLVNNGTGEATLQSLELGWGGDAALTAISVDEGAGAAVVFDGSSRSPAYVALGKATVRLQPGAVAAVRLAFDRPVDGADFGPVVSGFREGCLVASQPEQPSECALTVEKPSVPPTLPNDIRIAVTNAGIEPAELVGIRLGWPQATNGSILMVGLDASEIAAYGPGEKTSPAYFDLRKLLPAPVKIEPGGSVTIRARFENAASDLAADYAVAVDDGGGCASGASPVDSSNECGVRVAALTPGASSARVDLVNVDRIPRTLTGLRVFWPAATTGSLVQVQSQSGATLWQGDVAASPAQVELTEQLVVPSQGRSTLRLAFKPSGGKVEEASVTSGGDMTVVAYFGGGCQSVFTTRGANAPACSLSAGDLSSDGSTVSLTLANSGSDARLGRVALGWPESNGALRSIALSDRTLWEGVAAGRSFTQTITSGDESTLPQNERRSLAFGFESDAAAGPYSLSLSFDDLAGQPCDELLVSAGAPSPSCRLGLGGATIEDFRFIVVPLENGGPDDTRLQYLQLEWPTDGINGLATVTLTDPDGAEHRLFGGKVLPVPPARIVPEATTFIRTGTSTLRFQFTGTFADGDEAAVGLDVVADGCHAALRPGTSRALPVTERFSGSIAELPRDGGGLFGTWKILVLQGNRSVERDVWVDTTTELEPPNVGPELGDRVTVEAVSDADGRLQALHIRFQRAAFQELVGEVTELDPGQPVQWIKVGDTTVHIRDAIVDGKVAKGSVVRASGMTNADGSLTAMRVTVIDAHPGQYVEVSGVIQDASEDPDDPLLSLWNVDGRRVRVLPGLVVNPLGTPPGPGSRVYIKGRLSADTVLAVTASATVKILPPLEPVVIIGTVVSAPEGGVGPWVIRTDGGETKQISVASAAVVDSRTTRPDPGARVRVVAYADDTGALTAARIRTDWGP